MGTSELAASVRALRVRIGLTQEDLAEKAGISVRTISDIERGLRSSVYRDTAERLADALEVDPSARPGFVAAARGRVRPPSRVAADRPGRPGGKGAIPIPPTRLIDREIEMELLSMALADRSIRALTLTGPGGIGKSRLAVESAARARHLFDGGVFFVQLTAVDDPERVLPSIADALGLADPDVRTAHDLISQLGPARILLVLDTFEHLLDAAPLVGEILSLTERIHVLATTRESLGIRGEHVIVVPPLDLPAEGSTRLTSSASGRLLLDRALAVRPTLVVDESSSAVLSDICRRLSGLPLAIELAASRIRHLPLVTLRAQLESRLSVLTKGAPDLPRRQRTIRDTIAWSYDLLSDSEQALFRAASVFKGGWTLDALIAVCSLADVDVDETLSALVDKSLVVLAETQSGDPRYSMMDLLGEFASEEADARGETALLCRRHASYFSSFAEEAENGVGTQAQESWFSKLDLDHDNLRAALRWSTTGGDAELGLRLAASLWQFWRAQGHLAEGRNWLDKTLGAAPDAATQIRTRALWGASWLGLAQDDLRSVQRYAEELLALTRDERDSIMRRNALTVRAMLAIAEGDYVTALSPLERSVEICEKSTVRWLLATSKLNLGLVRLHLRQLSEAARLLDEAGGLFVEVGDARFAARVNAYRGHLALLRRDTAEAKRSFTEALHRFAAVADEAGIAESLEGSAATLAADGFDEPAALVWGAASRLRARTMSRTLPFERALLESWLDKTQAAVGRETWDELVARGAAMEPEEAMSLVTTDGEIR